MQIPSGIAMRAPSIPCRRAVTDEGSDIVARGNVLVGVCMSALVWALATAKMIDLSGCAQSVSAFQGKGSARVARN